MTERQAVQADARILLVDDQEANNRVLEMMLSAEGYKAVYSTTDPGSVAERYRRERFDLIVLDINMPGMDGFGVMKSLQGIDPTDYLPILVLTAQGDQATKLRALRAGAKDFLGKPFERVEILTRIGNMLEIRLMHRQVRDQNRILETKVQERTRELHDTRLEIIRRLGRASEYRDNETGLHIIRMSKYSERLALAAGMSAGEAEMLLNASPMHDVGKIGIPDSILLKPGKLDSGEWEHMKRHTTIGAEILAGHDSELMRLASVVALTHHEKWDGSGYPMGLAKEAIPHAGRIVALCDVFDALTSDRPYKTAWDVGEAAAYIKSNSGIHFDPDLAGLFERVLPEFLEIKAQYAEPSAS